MDEKKRFIFTTIAVCSVGMITGFFLGGGLMPSQAAQQQYDEKVTTSKKELSIIHSHDNVSQYDHTVTIVTTITETTPHGYFHDFAAAMMAPGVAPAESGPKQAANEIWVWGREFRPNIMTVPVGTRIIWISKEGEEHSVTSTKPGLFDGSLPPYGSWSYTFTEPGSFEYLCVPHNQMTGVVNVK